MRKFFTSAVILIFSLFVVFLVADAVLKPRVEKRLESVLQQEANAKNPDVKIKGSVLIQGFLGKWETIQFSASEASRSGNVANDLKATLLNSHIKATDVASGKPILVDDLNVEGILPLSQINKQLPENVSLISVDRQKVQVKVFFSKDFSALGDVQVRVEGGDLVLVPKNVNINSQDLRIEGEYRIPLPALPSDLKITSLSTSSRGVFFKASGKNVLLER